MRACFYFCFIPKAMCCMFLYDLLRLYLLHLFYITTLLKIDSNEGLWCEITEVSLKYH